MFVVEWVIDHGRRGPEVVDTMRSPAAALADVIEHAKGMFPTIRDRFPRRQPTGFRVFDETGAEVYRWTDA